MRIITKTVKNREDIRIKLDTGEVRRVGYIRDNKYYVKRNPDTHLFIKNNSYAFSYDVLMMLPEDFLVVVNEWSHFSVLVTTVWDILKHNDYKYFKHQWFELQVFYNRNLFNVDLYKKFY